MKASRVFLPLLCAAVGFGVGAYVYPGPYHYDTLNGVSTRTNRVTGVQEFASSRGWVSQGELIRDSMEGGLSGMGQAFRSFAQSASGNRP